MDIPEYFKPRPSLRRCVWPIALPKDFAIAPGQSVTVETFQGHDADKRTIQLEALVMPVSFVAAGGLVSSIEVPTGRPAHAITVPSALSGGDFLRINLSNVELRASDGVTITIQNTGPEPITEVRGVLLVLMPETQGVA